MDERAWEWRPDGDCRRMPGDRSLENITESGYSGRKLNRFEKIIEFGPTRLGERHRRRSSMTSGFLTRAVGWMVEPATEERNLRGRCLEEKDEALKVGHAEFFSV